jgi:hypothetical protein
MIKFYKLTTETHIEYWVFNKKESRVIIWDEAFFISKGLMSEEEVKANATEITAEEYDIEVKNLIKFLTEL